MNSRHFLMPLCYHTCKSSGFKNLAGTTDRSFCCRLQEETMDNCLQKLRAACNASVSVKKLCPSVRSAHCCIQCCLSHHCATCFSQWRLQLPNCRCASRRLCWSREGCMTWHARVSETTACLMTLLELYRLRRAAGVALSV
jgi:hypothetical protein